MYSFCRSLFSMALSVLYISDTLFTCCDALYRNFHYISRVYLRFFMSFSINIFFLTNRPFQYFRILCGSSGIYAFLFLEPWDQVQNDTKKLSKRCNSYQNCCQKVSRSLQQLRITNCFSIPMVTEIQFVTSCPAGRTSGTAVCIIICSITFLLYTPDSS